MTGDRDEEEFRRDARVALAARALDPTLGRAVLSPDLSPSGIIELAKRSQSRPARNRSRLRGPAAVALAVIVALAAIPILTRRPTTGELLMAGSGLHQPPVSYYLGDGTEELGGPRLRGVAEVAARLVGEIPGPVTYVRVRTWSLDTTGNAPATTLDEQLWWTADRAGLSMVTTLDSWSAGRPPLAQPQRVDYAPGELAVVVEEPSTDPALLAAQLDGHEPLVHGPQAVLRGVRDLFRYHALAGPGRAAALRVLAETPGITVRGTVVLESGHAGLVVSADSEGGIVRDLAVFDPADGSLLAYQQIAARGRPVVTYSLTVLASGTTTTIGSSDIRSP